MTIDLRLGDCLEVMKTIESGSIDAIITDPPYGTTACKWDSVIDFDLMWEQLNRIIKPNGAIVLFGRNPFFAKLIISNEKYFKYEIIWNKNAGTDFAQANRKPITIHENIAVFCNGKINYNRINDKGFKPYSDNRIIKQSSELGAKGLTSRKPFKDKTTRTPTTIRTYFPDNRKGKGSSLHPTQKPVALMEYLIKTYTNEGEAVLDFTMGSGSTMVACQNLNRNGIGIEMDENYFNIASKRVGEKRKEKENEAPTLFNELN